MKVNINKLCKWDMPKKWMWRGVEYEVCKFNKARTILPYLNHNYIQRKGIKFLIMIKNSSMSIEYREIESTFFIGIPALYSLNIRNILENKYHPEIKENLKKGITMDQMTGQIKPVEISQDEFIRNLVAIVSGKDFFDDFTKKEIKYTKLLCKKICTKYKYLLKKNWKKALTWQTKPNVYYDTNLNCAYKLDENEVPNYNLNEN